MTRPRYVLRSVVLPMLAAFTLALAMLLTAHADSIDAGGVADTAAIGAVDAGAVDAPPVAVAAASPVAPAPVDPVAHPGDALAGLRAWWHTSWAYGLAFIAGSLLVGLGARVRYLSTGWRAVVVGTLTAAIAVALTGKAAGLSDAAVVQGALNVGLVGAVWLLRRNVATVDLSTATPEQIAAALAAAGQPPAFPTSPPSR